MELVFGYPDPVLRYKFINKYKKYYKKTEIYNLGIPIYKLPEDIFLEIIKYLDKEEKGILFQASDKFHIYGSYLKTNSPWIGAKMYYSYDRDGELGGRVNCDSIYGGTDLCYSEITIVNIDGEKLDVKLSANNYIEDVPIEANIIKRKERDYMYRKYNLDDIDDDPFILIDCKYTYPNELCSDYDIFPEVRDYIYKKIKYGCIKYRFLDEIHDELIPFITKKNMCEFNNLHEFSNKFSEPGTIGLKVFRNVLSFMNDSDRLDILLSDDTKSGMLRQLCFAMGVHDTTIRCIDDGSTGTSVAPLTIKPEDPDSIRCHDENEACYISEEIGNGYITILSGCF
jgi:hypothetical protein